jgi:hypothetical protein
MALSCQGMPESRVTNYLLPESETTVIVPRLRLTRFLLSKYARGAVVTRTSYQGMPGPIVTKYSISCSGMPRPLMTKYVVSCQSIPKGLL